MPRAESRVVSIRQLTGVAGHGSEDASHGRLRQAAYVRLCFALCEGARAWPISEKTKTNRNIISPWK